VAGTFFIRNETPATAGASYILTGKAATHAVLGTATIYLDYQNASGVSLGTSSIFTVTTTYADPWPLGSSFSIPSSVAPVGTTKVVVTGKSVNRAVKLDDLVLTVTCPTNYTVVYGNATATDNCGGTPTIVYSHPTGSTFPCGITPVTVTATDACGNSSTCTFTVTVNCLPPPDCNCSLNYPDNSNLPRSAVIFNESEILRKFAPDASNCLYDGVVKLWYNDEHALTLGVNRVEVKTSGGTTITDYPVATYSGTPSCITITNSNIGTIVNSGDQSGNDVAVGGGRPLRPQLFITDLTVNGATSRIGDWQQGGIGINPNSVCGSWKAAVRKVDYTSSPFPKITVTPAADPAKNNWTGVPDVPPGGFASLVNEGYGAECIWNVSSLGLIPGHSYRLQFMVHDGDQNKTGGDVGQACTVIQVPFTSRTTNSNLITSRNSNNQKSEVVESKVEVDEVEAEKKILIDSKEQLKLFPNPTSGDVEISFIAGQSPNSKITLFDNLGKQVKEAYIIKTEKGFAYRIKINTDKLSTGVYFVQLRSGDVIVNQKLVLIK
jgi:hypothetical protein